MKEQRWMGKNYFVFFLAWGIFLPYWTGFLVHEKDVSIQLASIMMSVGLVLRGLSTMFIFPLMTDRWSQKKVLMIFIIGSFLTAVLFIFNSPISMIFLLTCLLSFFLPAIMPGLDSTASILVQKHGIHYGRSRSYGSLGFVISVGIVSVISARFGDQSMLWLLIFYLFILLLLSFQQTPAALLEKPSRKKVNGQFKEIFKVRYFVVILLIVTLLQSSHAAYYNYGYIYLEHINVPKTYIGLVINIGVIFEILLFAVADKYFSKWNPGKILIIAATGAALRWFIVFIAPNAWIFALSQSLHALSFALAHYAFIMYMTKEMKTMQITKAQGIYSAFALSWGTALLTVLSGFFYAQQPNYAFLMMFIFTLPALGGALYLNKKYKSEEA